MRIEPNLNSNIEGSLFFNEHNQVEPKPLKLFLKRSILNMGGIIKKRQNLERFNFVNNILKIDELKFTREVDYLLWGME